MPLTPEQAFNSTCRLDKAFKAMDEILMEMGGKLSQCHPRDQCITTCSLTNIIASLSDVEKRMFVDAYDKAGWKVEANNDYVRFLVKIDADPMMESRFGLYVKKD